METQKRFCLILLIGLFVLIGFAKAQFVTVIPAIENNPTSDITIAKGTTNAVTFSLSTLPVGAVLKSCSLQLTVKTAPTDKITLDIQLGAPSTYPATLTEFKPRVSLAYLDKRNTAGSTLSLDVNPVFLTANLAGSLPMNLVYISSNNASCAFYNHIDFPGRRPRLIVTYELAPKPIEWAQAHGTAQRNRQSQAELKGAPVTSFSSQNIVTLNAIRQDLLMYKGALYLINRAVDNQVSLLVIDPIHGGQTVIAAVFDPVVAPAIDPFGRLYTTNANGVAVVNLETKSKTDRVITFSGNELPKASPAIGPDGSIYYALNGVVKAYSPFPQNKPIWYYSVAGTNSPVTLNSRGTIAYFVSYRGTAREGADTLFALDATNGKRLYKKAVDMVALGTDVAASMPLVTEDGTVYLVNHLLNAKKLFVFSDTLKPLQTIAASSNGYISLPTAGHGDAGKDSTVFFVNDGVLQRCFPRACSNVAATGASIPKGLSIRSIVSDRSNSVYCISNVNNPHCYAFVNNQGNYNCIDKDPQLGNTVAFQGALVEGYDGTLFAPTSSKVYAFRAGFFESWTYKASHVQENNRTFRGNALMISDGLTTNVNQIWIGKSSMRVGVGDTLGSTANIVIQSGGPISFGKNFKVRQGATLRCRTGY